MKLVIQNSSRIWGGNEKWLSIVAQGLTERGHSVVVSVPAGPVRDLLRSLGIRTSSFRPRNVLDPVNGLSFAAWLATEKPDAVLATSWNSLVWAALATRVAGGHRFVLRNGIVRAVPSGGAHALVIRKLVDAVIVNAPEIASRWMESAPWFDPAKIHVVLNALPSRRNEREQLRAALRNKLGVDGDTLLVGSAGNLARRKGFDVLLDAFARAETANAHLVIVGDGKERPALEKRVSDLGIASRIHFLGRRPDGPDIIAGLDLFVLTRRNEGMANVMLEAMAAGVPVIASQVSGVQTALGPSADRGSAGWILDEFGVDSFTAAISGVVAGIRAGDSDVKLRTGESLWRIEHWFTRDRMVRECEEILFPR